MSQGLPGGQAVIPAESIGWMRAGEALLAATIDRAAPLHAPSRLPGWDRAHVVSHVAGNADALLNLLKWAATGVERPMYASAQARDAEIDTWSAADPAALVRRAADARERLDAAVRTLPTPAWEASVRTNSGRDMQARLVPWMRVREVYIHAVDLDAATTFDDVPEDVRSALVDDVVASLSTKPDCPAVELCVGERRWRLGDPSAPAGHATRIEGRTTAGVVAWLTGRAAGADLSSSGSLPPLPCWL